MSPATALILPIACASLRAIPRGARRSGWRVARRPFACSAAAGSVTRSFLCTKASLAPHADTMSDLTDVLNLGSGRRKIAGAVNIDISDQVGADVVHDLTALPWPLPSDRLDRKSVV